MMTTYTGQFGAITLGANSVAEVRSFEINSSLETIDDTVMGDSWRTKKALFKNGSGSAAVLYDHDNATGQGALSVGAELAAKFYPSQNASGAAEIAGTILVTERTVKTSHDGMVEMDITFDFQGAIVEGEKT